MTRDEQLRIYSWNVNGIRACEKKGFRKWLDRSEAFLAGLQEVRARPEQLPLRLNKPRNWFHHIVCAERKGYSGVSSYSRDEPDEVSVGLGVEAFDREGRVHFVRFGKLLVANVYFPNGNGKDRDNSRVPYKLDFYRCVLERLEEERKRGLRVLVMGDFNTAHREIDLARPKSNTKTSGFLMEERVELDRWTEAGWVDTFRMFEDTGDHYTWWAQRGGCRERNVGWRIDYIFAAPEATPFVKAALIQPKILGSDHCPIRVDVSRWILE
ncbi:MAG: exodeoxyribonuclease III [Myxococcales bacterium]|nr:exodeoxyribonuclease III [Myxococcales bacterium]